MVASQTVIATTFEIAPKRVDLLAAILTGAGVGGLFGSAVGQFRGLPREARSDLIERFAVVFAVLAVGAWAISIVAQSILGA